MAENHKEGITVYVSGITNLVTITAAGLAASTALMQLAGADANNRPLYIWSLICFFVALVSCFITMAGLTGQAMDEAPSVDVWNIRWPALTAFFLACVGFVLLGLGASKAPEKVERVDGVQLILKMESCRSEAKITPEQRLKCYDSFLEAQISDIKLVEKDLNELSDKDRAWIKTLILKNGSDKK